VKLRLLTAAAVVALALAVVPAVAGAAEWTPAPVALPAGATGGLLYGVDCPEAGSCVAVGASSESDAVDPQALKPMVVTEAGGTWGQGATVGRPGGALATSHMATTLMGVSCPTAGSCVAVGFEAPTGGYWVPKTPVAAVETDGTWGEIFQIAPPGGATYAVLKSVSCRSVGSCVAVGGDESGPFAVTETDGSWGPAVQIPPTAPATEEPSPDPITFGSVSCPAVGSCVGAGVSWNSAGERQPSVATATDGDWGEAFQVTPPTAGGGLGGVSCTAVGACVAVGGNGPNLFAVTYADGTWAGATSIIPPAGAPLAVLSGVSCQATDSCLAAGTSYPHEHVRRADARRGDRRQLGPGRRAPGARRCDVRVAQRRQLPRRRPLRGRRGSGC
jgi:hypothetical protein